MKRCCFLLLFLLYFVFLSFAVDRYEEVPGSGLFIESVPSGAKVFIDGAERGLTPYSNSSLNSGEYNIRINKEGYKDRRFRVVIRRGSRVEISVDLEETKGQLMLKLSKDPESPPFLEFNPRVFIDGSRIPFPASSTERTDTSIESESLPDSPPDYVTTPLYEQNLNLAAGWHTITVEAFGWEKISTRILVEEDNVQKLDLVVKPSVFVMTNTTLRKKRFNPRNSGILGNAEINFTVSAPGTGLLEVFDDNGTLIYSRALSPFIARQQQALWNGRDTGSGIVNDGHYILRISAWQDNETEKQSTELSVQVDSSITIRPLGIASSVAGLFLVPSPEALPALSYQIDGSLIAGKPLQQGAWESLPFAIGFRFSFLDNLETTIAFNAIPVFSGDYDLGIGGSLKWVLFRPLNTKTGSTSFFDSFGMAAELSYGWATTGPYTAFGMGTGLGLRLPLMYRILQGTADKGIYSFNVLLSPLVLWASEKGHPDTSIPRPGIEGGVLFNYGSITSGFSLRWDYDTDAQRSGPLVSALEFKFSPSSFVLSLNSGFWVLPDAKDVGVFFGVGLGIIY
ncbi:MAG: PEGA domain-containing protein [Treponema sp.]|nr:PEGA domain-containing protein [Treponema sp.]